MTTNSTPIPNVAVNGGYVGFVSAHSGFMLLKSVLSASVRKSIKSRQTIQSLAANWLIPQLPAYSSTASIPPGFLRFRHYVSTPPRGNQMD